MNLRKILQFHSDFDEDADNNDNNIDADQKFFVLGEFQDYLFTASLVVCVVGTFLSGTTAVVFCTKKNKQSKDIFACALSTVDVTCNLSGILFTLSQLSKWGYTKCACQVTIYFWRMTPTLSWLLILSIALSRYLAVVEYDYFKRNFTKRKIFTNITVIIVTSFMLCVPFIFTCNEVHGEDYGDLKGATRPLNGDYIYTASIEAGKMELYAAVYRLTLAFIIGIALVILYGRIVYELSKRKRQSRKLLKELRRVSETPQLDVTAPTQDFEVSTTTQEYIENLRIQLERLTWFFSGAKEYVKNHLSTTFGFSEDSDAQTEVMFINVALLFGLTNVPYAVVETVNNFTGGPNPNPRGESSLLLLFVLGFNMNPLIFYSVNVWFRETINNALRKLCCNV